MDVKSTLSFSKQLMVLTGVRSNFQNQLQPCALYLVRTRHPPTFRMACNQSVISILSLFYNMYLSLLHLLPDH
jgi:hypothetical protein